MTPKPVQPSRSARSRYWPLLALTALFASCGPPRQPELTIAAAANLTAIFKQIGPEFERETGIHPVFSFASTAQLTRQAENAAPFDLIAAADSEHVEQLDHKELLAPGSRAVYAIGVLALWIPPGAQTPVAKIEDLAKPEVRVIAVAKPELAPYGQAAVETLQRLGIWEQARPKIVYAENISMAKQFGASRNADAVFTARSLVLEEPGKIIVVDESLHRPITQELGILRASRHPDAAAKFAAFLLHGRGRDLLAAGGYRAGSGNPP
jgi:molybdate transport system substrate-binding protein